MTAPLHPDLVLGRAELPEAFDDAEWWLDSSRRRYRVRLWREGASGTSTRSGRRPDHLDAHRFRPFAVLSPVAPGMHGLERWEDTDSYAETLWRAENRVAQGLAEHVARALAAHRAEQQQFEPADPVAWTDVLAGMRRSGCTSAEIDAIDELHDRHPDGRGMSEANQQWGRPAFGRCGAGGRRHEPPTPRRRPADRRLRERHVPSRERRADRLAANFQFKTTKALSKLSP